MDPIRHQLTAARLTENSHILSVYSEAVAFYNGTMRMNDEGELPLRFNPMVIDSLDRATRLHDEMARSIEDMRANPDEWEAKLQAQADALQSLFGA